MSPSPASRDDAAPAVSVPPEATPRRRPSPSATVWLTLVWVLLWGQPTLANIASGLVIAALVSWALPLPRVPFAGRVSLLGVLRLFAHLAVDITVASVHVAAIALRLGRQPHGGVLRVPLRSRSDLYLTLTADLCSLVPGSIIVEAHRSTGMLYVHTLDLEGTGAIEHAREIVLRQEERVMYALASPQEIAAAGLPPRRFGRASRAGGAGGVRGTGGVSGAGREGAA